MTKKLVATIRGKPRLLLGVALIGGALLLAGLHVSIGFAHLSLNAPMKDNQFSTDFEGADLSDWPATNNLQVCCDDSAVLTTEEAREGRQSARISLRQSDPRVKGSKRSEFRLRAVPFAAEVTYGFSVLVPVAWQADQSNVTVAQWHAVPDKLLFERGRPPPLRLLIKQNEWIIVSQWADKRLNCTRLTCAFGGAGIIWQGPVEKGKWTDWEFTVHWTFDDTGYLRVTKNQEQVADHKGPNAYNDAFAPYFKLGLYIPEWADEGVTPAIAQRTIYLDRVYERRHAAGRISEAEYSAD